MLLKFVPLTTSIIGLRILKSNRGLISFQIACMHKKAAACNLICTAAVCASLQNNWPAQRAALLQSAERQRGDAVRRSIDQHARVPGVFFTPDSVVASRIGLFSARWPKNRRPADQIFRSCHRRIYYRTPHLPL